MTLLEQVRARLAPAPAQPVTTRYGGPSWETRRARVLTNLGIDVVIDVGANSGQYGYEIRSHGYEGRIISFEPGSDAFAGLTTRSQLDELWSAHQLALGSHTGSAALNIAANEGKSSSFLPQREVHFGTTANFRYVATEMVEVATLEQACRDLVSARDRAYLKIDVQGLELPVIEGAAGFLSRVLAIETELALFPLYEGHTDWREMCERLEHLGFTFFAVDPGYGDPDSGRLVEMDALFVRHEHAQLH